jgi:hypothetical protein
MHKIGANGMARVLPIATTATPPVTERGRLTATVDYDERFLVQHMPIESGEATSTIQVAS